MLDRIGHLTGSRLIATDGEIGHVKEAWFDDCTWVIRHLVVDTSMWLPGRDVLISPRAVQPPLGRGRRLDVSLTRRQVESSPSSDTHHTITRQHDRDYPGQYGFSHYWVGGDLWGGSALPLMPLPLPSAVESEAESAARQARVPPEDVNLCSSEVVDGYDIQATDGGVGHVEDFLFDDESWTIRYLIVDTRNWWPGGRRVLIETACVDRIDWAGKTVFTRLTGNQIRSAPAYESGIAVDRDYERQLHAAHGNAA